MKANRLTPAKLLKESQFWLIAIVISLTTLYINLFWITRAIKPLAISLIFLSAVGVLLWRKRKTLILESEIFSSFLGTLILAFVLLKTFSLSGSGHTLQALPLIAAFGLSLLASGFKGFKQYWQELTILLALAIPGDNFLLWWLKIFWINYLFKGSKIWLLFVAVSLTAIYFHLVWLAESLRLLDKGILAILAVLWLLWQKREKLRLESNFCPRLIGTACIAFVLFKSSEHPDSFLQTLPLFYALGIALITSGFLTFKQYWRELTILFVLALIGLLKHPIEDTIGLTTLTAQFVNSVLNITGHKTILQGTIISLPTGAIDVVEGCSGYKQISWLVEIGVIYLVLFPDKLINNIIVPAVATLIAFVGNGLRVALLATLVSSSNNTGFEYWHEGEGSRIFATISLIVFGSFCLYLIRQMKPENENSEEFSSS